jgi:uncharacterized membrane protein YfcA
MSPVHPPVAAVATRLRLSRLGIGVITAVLLTCLAAALLLGVDRPIPGLEPAPRQVAYLLCAACGLFAGFLSGLLGIGGALIVVPALYLLLPAFGVDDQRLAHVAVATSLAVMLPLAVMAAWSQHRRGALAMAWLARLAPVTLIGACLGGLLALQLRGPVLTLLFAAQSLYFGWGLMRFAAARPGSSRARLGRLVSHVPPGVAGLGSAMLSTCAGMGGGTLTVPYLVSRGVPLRNAAATSSALNTGIATGGVLSFTLAAGTPWVHWPVAAVVGACATAAVPWGVAVAHRLPVATFRRTLGLVTLLSGCVLFARVLTSWAAIDEPSRFAANAWAMVHAHAHAPAPIQANAHVHATAHAPAHARGQAQAQAHPQVEADFRRYALNALLVPLIDESELRPRWTVPHELLNCGPGTGIRIDGQPLARGADVPPGAFTVQWQIDHCLPFGPDGTELAGQVELDVFRDDEGFSAIVRPRGLRLMPPLSTWSPTAPMSHRDLSATFVDSMP